MVDHMDKERLTDYIHNVLISIHENIREINERKGWAESKDLAHIEAKLLAYNEVLKILRTTAYEMGLPEEELGL